MEQKIINLLQITKHQYEMLTLDHFFLWCMLNSQNDQDLQRIIANKQVEQWFMSEYRKLQLKFLKIAEPYRGYCSKHDFEHMYKQEVIQISQFYPKSLLKRARSVKLNIYGYKPNSN